MVTAFLYSGTLAFNPLVSYDTAMKVVILGAGKRGTLLARHLIQEKRDVVIIESDPRRASEIQSKLDCMVVVGSGTDIDKLREAEVHKASSFIAVTDSDEVNLVACGLVENIETRVNTIAAIRNLTYTGKEGVPTTVLGINYIVNPEAEAAKSIFGIIDRGVFHNVVITFNNSNLVLYNHFVHKNSVFANRNVANCRSALKTEFVIAAIHRDGEGIVPSGNTVIYSGDTVSIVAFDSDKETLSTLIGQQKLRPKKIIIVGGSKIARFLLRSFPVPFHKNITLVEQNFEVAEVFANLFPHILVVQSDITDESIFEDERFSSYDLLISVTDNDELNIITASYAKHVKVPRSIALVKNNNNYVRLASHMGINSVISVSESTVDSLLKYMRGSHVSSVHSLFGGAFEIFEFIISGESRVVGKQIKEINMKNRGVIAGITSKGKNIIPTGNYTIIEDDILIVCAGREHLEYINQLFS